MKKIDPALLMGKRIFLREMTERDAPYLVSWRNDPEIKKWLFRQETLTVSDHIHWFKKNKPDRVDYIICDKEAKKPIGTVNYINISEKEAEAGKMLGDKSYWGGGYAKEAFKIWLTIGFEVFGFEKIKVKTMLANNNNIGLNKKLGFIDTGQTKIQISPGNVKEVLIMEINKRAFYEKKF